MNDPTQPSHDDEDRIRQRLARAAAAVPVPERPTLPAAEAPSSSRSWRLPVAVAAAMLVAVLGLVVAGDGGDTSVDTADSDNTPATTSRSPSTSARPATTTTSSTTTTTADIGSTSTTTTSTAPTTTHMPPDVVPPLPVSTTAPPPRADPDIVHGDIEQFWTFDRALRVVARHVGYSGGNHSDAPESPDAYGYEGGGTWYGETFTSRCVTSTGLDDRVFGTVSDDVVEVTAVYSDTTRRTTKDFAHVGLSGGLRVWGLRWDRDLLRVEAVLEDGSTVSTVDGLPDGFGAALECEA